MDAEACVRRGAHTHSQGRKNERERARARGGSEREREEAVGPDVRDGVRCV